MSVAALRVSEISGLNLEKMQGRAFFAHRQKNCPYNNEVSVLSGCP